MPSVLTTWMGRSWLVLGFLGATVALSAQPSYRVPATATPPAQKSAKSAILVFNFRFVGNTVFSANELARLLQSYRYHALTSEDLEEARQLLTRHYVNAGYINSGALLDDQKVRDHEVTFRIIEGRLSDVRIEGTSRLRPGFIRSRIEKRAGPPLNARNLEDALFILKENPNLKRINAELKPDAIRGQAILDMQVQEANPWQVGLQARNDRPASVGGEVLELLASHSNVSGNGDSFEVRYGIAQRTRDGADFSGADNIGASYTLPVTRHDTTMQVFYNRTDYSVIEEPFDALDLRSESSTYGIGLRHPIYKTYRREVALGLLAERRESKTFLLDQPISLSPGAVDGKTVETVLRFYQEWVERGRNQVLGFRSTFSLGLDVLGSTDDGSDRDGQFFSWIGQGQMVRRIGQTPHQILASTWFQWSSDPLLSLEQFAIGGANTVRGYRENQLVRDTAVIASVEVQFALMTDKIGNPVLQLAPFYDFGAGWNVDSPTPDGSNLMSAGLGVIYHPNRHLFAKLYWGYPFRDFNRSQDLQDYGIHFRINAFLF